VKRLSFESTLVRVKRGLIPPDALELVPTQSRLEAPVHGGPVQRSAVPATPSSRSFEADDRRWASRGSKVSDRRCLAPSKGRRASRAPCSCH